MRPMLLILLVVLLSACGRASAPGAEPLELRQYTVPADRTQPVVNTLNGVLMGSEWQPAVGRASSDVPGQVAVLAPARIHDSIRRTIDSLVAGAADIPHGGSVRIDYWLVDAVPGSGEDDPALAAPREALAASRAALGEVHFVSLGHVALVSTTLDRGSASTQGAIDIGQSIRRIEGGVLATMTIRRRALSPAAADLQLTAEAELPFATTVVLAQQAAGGSDVGVQRLVLVRAEPVGAQ